MKFCAILRNYPKDTPGGAEYQAYLIARGLGKRGHEVHYVAHSSTETSTTQDDGIIVHRMEKTGNKNIVKRLRSIDPDTCYFRLATDLPLLARVKRHINSTFVYNVSRNIQCESLFAGGPYRDSESLARRLFNTGRYAVYRALLRVPDHVFAQNKRQRQLLHDNHGIESTLVGNGHAVPEGEIDKESPPIVLWLSNLKSIKNPKLFLEVADQCQDLPCKFCMVGRPIDDDLHRTVLRQAAGQDNLKYHGGCGIVESNEYFAKASVYLHTGNTEGFPNTFIQSWMHQTPVIALKTDPDAVLQQHEIGVRCESIDEMMSQVARLIAEPNLREVLGENAQQYASAEHSIEAVIDRIETELCPEYR